MYRKEKKIIDKMSDEEKAKTWSQLNSYITPKKLKHIKKGIKRLRKLSIKEYERNSILNILMTYIYDDIGHRKCSYGWWKLQKLDIENHDEWFDKNYNEL